ncbi:uncharacterized protein LOC129952699 [Eupeodes corollae]|uniref:uncharacterized protein LOC129952699 n=1 Tax=Eupeodes corollae TaxID=290404 RepID=UPI00249071F2|nr:uncharacterized protein LOC129952699 [Eupeodes corollae]
MKFFNCAIFVVVMFMNSEANVLPLTLSPVLPYSATAYGSAVAVSHYNSQPILVHQPTTVIRAATHVYNTPLIWPFTTNTVGTYIAKTLGSEHIASLPGHLNSASSINLEQAPGVKKENINEPISSSVAIHGSYIRTPLSSSQLIVPSPASFVLPIPEAKYIAKNLGVEHVAPLPGHIISATSLNLQPAPGSK